MDRPHPNALTTEQCRAVCDEDVACTAFGIYCPRVLQGVDRDVMSFCRTALGVQTRPYLRIDLGIEFHVLVSSLGVMLAPYRRGSGRTLTGMHEARAWAKRWAPLPHCLRCRGLVVELAGGGRPGERMHA